MILTIRARALVSWIACWAVLLGSLAPAISHALAADTSADLAGVCSALGPKVSPAGRPGDGSAPSSSHALFEHCPFCSLHADPMGMPPSPFAALAMAGFDVAEPPRRVGAAPLRIEWAAAQPRAPPMRLRDVHAGTRSPRT